MRENVYISKKYIINLFERKLWKKCRFKIIISCVRKSIRIFTTILTTIHWSRRNVFRSVPRHSVIAENWSLIRRRAKVSMINLRAEIVTEEGVSSRGAERAARSAEF